MPLLSLIAPALALVAAQAKPAAMDAHTPRIVHAGVITAKFQDGELRYLYFKDREVFRRLYFAVRDDKWNTVMPALSNLRVETGKQTFHISYDAHCVSAASGVDYTWHADMVGDKGSHVTFKATGTPGKDFGSNRIGICVLHGADALQNMVSFSTEDKNGKMAGRFFPTTITSELVAPKYQNLRYKDDLQVSVKMTGATFDMEDQRLYGDSSFKAYAPLPYAYPQAKKGQTLTQTLVVQLEAVPTVMLSQKFPAVPQVSLGATIPGSRVPVLLPAPAGEGNDIFTGVSGKSKSLADATSLAWSYSPAVHLPDDDTFIENTSGVGHQVRSAKSYAPKAKITVAPITFHPLGPNPPADAREGTPFAAVWSLLTLKHLSETGADEAGFAVGDGPVQMVLAEMAKYAGRPVRQVTLTSPEGQPSPVQGFAVDAFIMGNPGTLLWVANTTNKTQSVVVTGLPKRFAFDDQLAPGASTPTEPKDGTITVQLPPYGIYKLLIPTQ